MSTVNKAVCLFILLHQCTLPVQQEYRCWHYVRNSYVLFLPTEVYFSKTFSWQDLMDVSDTNTEGNLFPQTLSHNNNLNFNLKGNQAPICLVCLAFCVSLEWRPFTDQSTRWFRALRALQCNPTSWKKLYSRPYGWEPVISPWPLSVLSLSPRPPYPSAQPTAYHQITSACSWVHWAVGGWNSPAHMACDQIHQPVKPEIQLLFVTVMSWCVSQVWHHDVLTHQPLNQGFADCFGLALLLSWLTMYEICYSNRHNSAAHLMKRASGEPPVVARKHKD